MDWRIHERPPAVIEPLPYGVEVFDKPQLSAEGDERFMESFIVFSAFQGSERDVADLERRHGFVRVAELTPLGNSSIRRTVVTAIVGSKALMDSTIRGPSNRLEVEFALQTPRARIAEHLAITRVKRHLQAMQDLAQVAQDQRHGQG